MGKTARAGRGRAVFLVGESGIGKTRLIAEATEPAQQCGMRVLRGRGSAIGPPTPFRSLTEALLSLLRSDEPVDLDALGPYRPVLAALLPDAGHRSDTPTGLAAPGNSSGSSLVILAEAILRLVGIASQGRGCLLVLDDLQNADAETLAVLEYLTDNLDRQPVLLLGAVQDRPCPALDLVRSIGRRGAGRLIDLPRLDRDGTIELAAEHLDVPVADLPPGFADLLWAFGHGNPFLIEELVIGVAGGGTPGADVTAELTSAKVPASFVQSMARQLVVLGSAVRTALLAGAILGSRFPITVVAAVSGLAPEDLLGQLRHELCQRLVTVDQQAPDWCGFRHELIMESMLATLVAGERADLARRTADVLESVYPGLPGDWCQLCAALRLAAGEPRVAGLLFAKAGERALGRGAVRSAAELLDRAWRMLAHDVVARASVLETRLLALAEEGRVDQALVVESHIDEVAPGLSSRQRIRLHTRLAWVANLAGRTADGLRHVAESRSLLGADSLPEDLAELDVVAAHLEMELPGRLGEAEAMARRAATLAERAGLPNVACQAWQLLGALTRSRNPDEAIGCLERSRAIAARNNLPVWEIHALVRLGLVDALRDGRTDRLEQAKRWATRIGAVTAQYQADVNLVLQLVLCGEHLAAEAIIDQVLAATTRLKMLEITQFMLVRRAILAGHRGRRVDMEAAITELRRCDGDQPQHVPRLHGLARAYCALLEENRVLARAELSTALKAENTNPTTFLLSGRFGLDLLLRALAGEVGWQTYRDITANPASQLRWDRQFAAFARAVLAGRGGQPEEAMAAVSEAVEIGRIFAMGQQLGLRLVAEAALADDWGTPVPWLQAAEEYFHDAGITAVAEACRAMLRSNGNRVHARRRGTADIPAALRAVGVTAREYDVLRLLIPRLGDREIAERLHLSRRTVEKHVSNLINKTGAANRVALSRLALSAMDNRDDAPSPTELEPADWPASREKHHPRGLNR